MVIPVATACRCENPLACEHVHVSTDLIIADDGILIAIAIQTVAAEPTTLLYLDLAEADALAAMLTKWSDLARTVH